MGTRKEAETCNARDSYIRDTIIGSCGWSVGADPFTDGVEMMPNLQTISARVGANRKAGMICDNTTSRWKDVVRLARLLAYDTMHRVFPYSFQAVKI